MSETVENMAEACEVPICRTLGAGLGSSYTDVVLLRIGAFQ